MATLYFFSNFFLTHNAAGLSNGVLIIPRNIPHSASPATLIKFVSMITDKETTNSMR